MAAADLFVLYSESGQLAGYFIRGWHSAEELAIAVNNNYGGVPPTHFDPAIPVRQCYARIVGDWSEGRRESVYHWTNKPGRGAFRVTLWEP